MVRCGANGGQAALEGQQPETDEAVPRSSLTLRNSDERRIKCCQSLLPTQSMLAPRAPCPTKAFSEYLVETILAFVEALGHNVVMLNSDQEPLLVHLLKAVQSRRVKRTLVRHDPKTRTRAFLSGLAGIWDGEWGVVAATHISCRDIELWLYSTLHWPQDGADLGVGGVSYVELLILYELCAGERLVLEKAVPRNRRAGRSISVSAVPFGPGTDIWRSCRFIGAMMRSLCLLPGGLERFMPCSIGAEHCRLRHFGWEKCGHGLTSRPRESASEPFFNKLLRLFNYPPGSARALLAGTLPLRYFAARFASRTPTWRLPVPGQVASLVTASSGVVQEVIAEDVDHGVHWVSGSGPGRKEFDQTEKPLHTSRV